jgi:hypothetical protein
MFAVAELKTMKSELKGGLCFNYEIPGCRVYNDYA